MKSYVPPPGAEKTQKKKRSKGKQTKDKNAPKGASSSYIMFATEMRAKLLAANPDMKSTDLMKECGAKWRELSAEDKVPYEELAAADKVRYTDEMTAYKATQDSNGAEASDADEDINSGSDNGSGSDSGEGSGMEEA